MAATVNLEPNLATYAATADILRRFDLTPRKRHGQNFLVDPRVREKIIAAAAVSSSDNVLEIGPGIGALTQALAVAAKRVIAVELDDRFVNILRRFFSETPQVEILHKDFMKLDLKEILSVRNFAPYKVVANLPYYITTPILMRLLETECAPESVTILIQREVAQRLAASAGSQEYGALSVMVQYYADVHETAAVPSHCFYPRPKVDSAVVTLTITQKRRQTVYNERFFAQTVKAAFGKRRKTLVNCLTDQPWLTLSKENISVCISACGFDAQIRGEALSVNDFILLANALDVFRQRAAMLN
jgi:16S rRNA (adenine1518-N6/adenine1519-N6)-dimethyltransferase